MRLRRIWLALIGLLALDHAIWFLPDLRGAVAPEWFWGLLAARLLALGLAVAGRGRPQLLRAAWRVFAGYAFVAGLVISASLWAASPEAAGTLTAQLTPAFWRGTPPSGAFGLAGASVVYLAAASVMLPRCRVWYG